MQVFLDTNVLIAAVTEEPDVGAEAVALLNADHKFMTSLLNVMELRTVLTKQHRLEAERAAEIEEAIRNDIEVVIPDAEDVLDANELQQETLLYPLDALILACAVGCDATLASFDAELVENGAVEPTSLLDESGDGDHRS